MQYTIPIPERLRDKEFNAGHVHRFLEKRGVTVQGVSIGHDAVVVEADNDPRAALGDFDVEPSRREQILKQLSSADIDNASNAQLKQAVKLLVELVQLNGQ